MRTELKNLFGVSMSLFLSCGAWTAVYSLASTIHTTDGVGLASFSLLFVGHALMGLFAPILVTKFGTKNCTVVGMLCWAIYIGCNLYPNWYVLLPVSILTGIGSVPLWIAAATHLTSSAIQLAKTSPKLKTESTVSQFIGVYFLAQLFSTIPGNLTSSLVLFQGTSNIDANHSTLFCGSQDCNHNSNDTSEDENPQLVDARIEIIMFSALLACCLAGFVIAVVAIDSLQTFCDDLPEQQGFKDTSKMTFRILFSPTFFLIVPLIALNGFELGFLYGIFTKSFVSCTLGVQTIGFVMTASGFGGAVFAMTAGALTKVTGRIPIATFGFISQCVLIPCMVTWNPEQAYQNNWHLYIMGLMWSGGATLCSSQITVLLGILFPRNQEAVYGCHLFFHFTFYALPTALRIPNPVCTGHLLQLQMGMLLFAILSYSLLEWIIRQRDEPLDDHPIANLEVLPTISGNLTTALSQHRRVFKADSRVGNQTL